MVAPASTGGNSNGGQPAASCPATRSSSTHPSHSHNVPLSARRSAPLDLSTVERRGQPFNPREPVKRARPHGLQEAPSFHPTEEEFKDPVEYIRRIAPLGKKYGICRVVPPENWQPPFAIDTERFHFKTRRQELNSVEGGTRANLNYLDQLAKFHKQHGTNLNRFPSVDKRPLDLYKLKKAVEARGGFDSVCKTKKWAEIGRDLGYSGKIMSSLSTSLKNSYQRWLQPYEEYLRVAKPGVQQQLEIENGGPLTPSPHQSPLHKKSLPVDSYPSSNAHQGTPALLSPSTQNTPKGAGASPEKPTPPTEPASSRPVPSGGFTPVNASGGFTAVNHQSPSFLAVNNGPSVKREPENGSAISQGVVEHSQSSTPIPNGHGDNGVKRGVSLDSNSQAENGDADGDNGRRSKRLKKDSLPTVAGSHMSSRPTPPRARKNGNGNGKSGEKCEACGKTEENSSILVCDTCDLGYHGSCLDPPVTTPPEYDWHCPKCLVGTGEFGFEDGGVYSLKQFQERANEFKKNYFASKMPFDPVLNTHRRETEDDVEREFWRLVESLTETVEVEYGADIHSTTHGSGFPTIERNPLEPYSVDPWNLNVLPFHGDSLFRHIKTDISGMTVPWVYVGMCFSTFCWHNEDHYAYSANYQHFGATKTWYGIPGDEAVAFEEAMRKAVPELFEGQPDLLFQLVTLMPPDQLRKAGVNVYAVDQRAGQFVLTFPQAYHAGFNHGFNFNEAVNFAPVDWEPWGAMGVERLQAFRRHPCFSHDELLVTAADRDASIATAKWLYPALKRTSIRELRERSAFINWHQQFAPHKCTLLEGPSSAGECQLNFVTENNDLPEEEYQCDYCKTYAYLTLFRCRTTGKTVCLQHVETFDCCGQPLPQRLLGPDHTLRYRMSDDELRTLAGKIEERARIPEAWNEKRDKYLEVEPKPQLKVLHNLLNEGEKIPYHLSGLHDLAAFVQRCDKWVEEANNYTTRKQQNRRKNEKAWRKGTSKAAQLEERDREVRRVESIYSLLAEADKLSFDCPQMAALEEKTREIEKFRQDVNATLMNPHIRSVQEVEDLVEAGRNFNVEIPEVEGLEHILRQMRWNDEARGRRDKYMTLRDCQELILAGEQLGLMGNNNEHLLYFKELCRHGESWESKAKELMSVEAVHYQQLEALSAQAARFPVTPETLAAVDAILTKQRDAQKKIQSLHERSKDPDFRQRPPYKEVRELIESLEELNSRPTGAIDLEREQKRHEDWMRKGKKLFGKANAPLHILRAHMEYVEKRNSYCFDLEDRYRPPVEPASRDNTPDGPLEHNPSGFWGTSGKSRKRDVFCICRHSEAGMMIECEVCHEWYHGKCLKIARGKIKEFDKYTCPICDWRQKIPRDAARPKIEDLQDWHAEIRDLPFQPEEEQILENIINQAVAFRDFVQSFTMAACTTTEEVPTLIFYLRKIEGAEVLLTYETNFFRQEIHKWAPVAPEPPPILEQSLSTRKPRPTKQQKIMAQLGIERVEDLPPHLRPKPSHMTKRKSIESPTRPPSLLQPAPHTPGGTQTTSAGGPTLTPMSDAQSQLYPFSASYSVPPNDSTPAFAPGSSAFLPHATVRSPSFPARSPTPHHQGLDNPLFGTPQFNREQGEGPSGVEVENSNPFGSSPRQDLDDVFADLTNQDDAEPEPAPEPAQEHEPELMENSHVNEALEVLDASNGDEPEPMQVEESEPPNEGAINGGVNGNGQDQGQLEQAEPEHRLDSNGIESTSLGIIAPSPTT